MKKIICCFILLLCSFYTRAQSNQKLDSLKKVLAKLPQEGASFAGDTMRVRVLCEMSIREDIANENLSIERIQQAINICENIEWENGLGRSYHFLGYLFASKNENMKAIEYLYKSLSITEKLHEDILTAKNYRFLGDCYSRLGSFDKSEQFINKSLTIYKQKKLSKNVISLLNSMGMVYHDAKNYQSAINYFHKGLNENKGKYKEIEVSLWANLGLSYIEVANYDSAMICFENSNKFFDTNNNLDNFTKTINIISLANVWNLKEKPEKALTYLTIAEKLHNENGNEITAKMLNKQYYEAYKKLNQPKKALYHYQKYIVLNNAMSEQDFKTRMNNLQYEYEYGNQKNQNEILQLNLKQEKLIKNGLGFGILGLILLGGFLWRNNKLLSSKNSKIEEQKSEITNINTRLEDLNKNLEIKVEERTIELTKANEELLRKNEEIMSALVEGQTIERKRVAIELHDNLGSMLSGMKWRLQALNKEKLSEKEQKVYEGILTMMGDAYSEVRLISHNLLPAELEKSGLQGALQKLANDINQSEKLQISVNFDISNVKIDKKTELELYGICMEMVNNILKHSQATKTEILFSNQERKLSLFIKDNGIGLLNGQNPDGMGLKNLNNRLETIGGKVEVRKSELWNTEIRIEVYT